MKTTKINRTTCYTLFFCVITFSSFAYRSPDTTQVSKDTILAASHMAKAKIQEDDKEFSTAIHHYKKAALLYKKNKIWDNYIQSLHALTNINLSISKPDSAYVYCQKAFSTAQQHLSKGHPEWGNIYFYFGRYYYEKSNYDKALEYHTKALNIRMETLGKNHHLVADSYNNIGNYHYDKGNFDESLKYHGKALNIRIKVFGENHRKVAGSYNNIGNCYYSKGNYEKVLEYYTKALNIFIKVLGENHHNVAAIYNNIGSCYFDKGDFDKSLEYNRKALSVCIKTLGENHLFVADAYNNIGNCYWQKDNYAKALEYHEKALDIRIKTLGKDHHRIAESYNNIGICYNDKGNYDKALKYHSKALNIKIKIFGENHHDVADSYNNIGICYDYKGNYDKALEYHIKALNIKLETLGENHLFVADSYNNIGICYDNISNFAKALEYHTKALNIRTKMLGKNHYKVADSYSNIGNCYYGRGNYREALDYHRKALIVNTKTLGEKHFLVATSYNNIGNCYQNMGNYIKALEHYNTSLNILTKILGEKHHDVANSYNNIGNCYYDLGDYKKALDYYEKAFEIRIKILGEKHHDVANSCINIGNCYASKGDYRKALIQYQQALIALCDDFKDTNITSNPSLKGINSKVHLLTALKRKAYTLTQKYDNTNKIDNLQLSLNTSHLAVSLIDSLRSEITSAESRQDLLDNWIDTYNLAIYTAFNLYGKTQKKDYLYQAFTVAEKSKAFLLLQGIKETRAKQFSNVPDSLLRKENDLKADISYYEKKLFELQHPSPEKTAKQDSDDIVYYQDELFRKKRILEQLITQFEKNYPQYYNLKYDLNVSSVDEIQKKILDEKKALIEYFIGDSSIYIFHITKDCLEAKRIQKPDELEKWVDDLRNGLFDTDSIYNHAIENYKLYTHTAHKLYDLLLAKIFLGYENPGDQLIIIPDGVLSYIPFEALLSERPPKVKDAFGINYKNLPYLVRQYQCSYSYSATLLIENTENQKIPIKRIRPKKATIFGSENATKSMAFAPDYKNNSSSYMALNTLRNNTLAPLPGTEKEVETLSRYFETTAYTKEEANEAQFKQKAGPHQIIHLAMHGIADDENPAYSKLFFSDIPDSTEDNILHTYEIYNLNIPTDLVVLSACETGTGQYARGEGLISMARAFMYAGCPSIVQTFWAVEDQPSASLMSFFYKNLSKDMNKSKALQRSKLEYIQSVGKLKSHPYYWAGFILNGDTTPLPKHQSSKVLFLLLLIPVALLSGYILFKKAKQNS